jgi:hypothetical protein
MWRAVQDDKQQAGQGKKPCKGSPDQFFPRSSHSMVMVVDHVIGHRSSVGILDFFRPKQFAFGLTADSSTKTFDR